MRTGSTPACRILPESVSKHRSAVETVCRERYVKSLRLFGSAVKGGFDEESSDVDFLVEFTGMPTGKSFDNYFDLKDDLKAIFGRKVDLVCTSAIRNPRFRDAAVESSVEFYEP